MCENQRVYINSALSERLVLKYIIQAYSMYICSMNKATRTTDIM